HPSRDRQQRVRGNDPLARPNEDLRGNGATDAPEQNADDEDPPKHRFCPPLYFTLNCCKAGERRQEVHSLLSPVPSRPRPKGALTIERASASPASIACCSDCPSRRAAARPSAQAAANASGPSAARTAVTVA